MRWSVLLAAGLLLASPVVPSAHEIPSRVTILAFVKPEGHKLHLLVRVPLEAMRDMQYPLRDGNYLLFPSIDSLLPDAARLWIADQVDVYEGTTKLADATIVAAHVALPSDRSFETYESAVAHVTGPGLPPGTQLAWQQAMMDVLFEYRISSDSSRFSINPELARLGVRTNTILRFIPAGGWSVHSNTQAIPVWCTSIRAGARRFGASSNLDSRTFSTASITCFSFCAW